MNFAIKNNICIPGIFTIIISKNIKLHIPVAMVRAVRREGQRIPEWIIRNFSII